MESFIPVFLPGAEKTEIRFVYTKEHVSCDTWENVPHLHPHYEMMFCVQGSYEIITDKSVFRPSRGDVRTYRSGELHMGRVLSDCVYEGFQFSIPKSAETAFRNAGLLECFINRPYGEQNAVSPRRKEEILAYLYELASEIENKGKDSEIFASTLVVRILCLVNRAFEAKEFFSAVSLSSRLSEILNYINCHFTEISTLGEIAAANHISISRLGSLFRDGIGITPYRYLVLKKINHAKMLLSTGSNVTEACYESGFCDYSHFIAAFKKYVGVTPHKYATAHGELGTLPPGGI